MTGAWRALLEDDSTGSFLWDLRSDTISCSPSAQRLLGAPGAGAEMLEGLHGLLHPEDAALLRLRLADCEEGRGAEGVAVQARVRRSDGGSDGEWNPLDIRLRTLPGADGVPGFLLGAVSDRAQQARAVAREAAEMSRIRLALRGGGLVSWEADARTGHVVQESGLGAMFGVPPAEEDGTIGPYVARVLAEDRDEFLRRFRAAATPGGQFRAEFRIRRPDGEIRWITAIGEAAAQPGGDARVVGFNADVTERKRLEEAHRAALETRDALLGEINHRLRNSLQLVSALLSLQSFRATGAEARAALGEARDRVADMARLHQRLYRRDDHARVRVMPLLEDLVGDMNGGRRGRGGARLRVEGTERDAERTIRIDRALPFAMIAAELLRGEMKRAAGRDAELTLSVAFPDDGALVLRIAAPGGVEGTEAGNGVAAEVVVVLARQVGATVVWMDGHPPSREVRLPPDPAEGSDAG